MNKSNGLYYGLAYSPEGELYAAQGNHDTIAVLSLDSDGRLTAERSIRTKKSDFPSGPGAGRKGPSLRREQRPAARRRARAMPSSVAVYDTKEREGTRPVRVRRQLRRDAELPAGGRGDWRTGASCTSPASATGRCTSLDTSDPAKISRSPKIETGSHPSSLLLDKSQSRLFVANAQSDTVSFVDTQTDKVTGTVLLRPEIAKDVAGATPTGLALSPDEKLLYVDAGRHERGGGDRRAGHGTGGVRPGGVVPDRRGRVAGREATAGREREGDGPSATPNPPARPRARGEQSPLTTCSKGTSSPSPSRPRTN